MTEIDQTGTPVSEETRVRRASENDYGAYEQLYRLHVGRVFALCLRLCSDRDMAEDLELGSVSGDIDVEKTAYKSIRAHSVSGDMDISGALLPKGVVEFDSVSGSLKLNVGPNPDARFDLETSSGRIRNQLTSDEPRASKYTRGKYQGRTLLRFAFTRETHGRVGIGL